jgi:hypothetical protein
MYLKLDIPKLVLLVLIITSCQGEKAIELVKEANTPSELWSFGLLLQSAKEGGLTEGGLTWNAWCNRIAKESPNKKFSWSSSETKENGIYIVGFLDEDNFGQHWEVNVKEEIIILTNGNEYLTKKYGFVRLDPENLFEITSVKTDTLRFFKKGNSINEIDYKMEFSLINRTNKKLTKADIKAYLKVIFEDKIIEGKSTYYSGFKNPVSSSNPWNPDSERRLVITTKSIEGIYASYEPKYVSFELELKASDPVGFTFNRNVIEYDLLAQWNKRKANLDMVKLYDYYEVEESTVLYTEPSNKSKKMGNLKRGINVAGVALVNSQWIKVKTKFKEGYVKINTLKPKI